MSWTNWAKKQPANKTVDQDCAVLNKEGKFEAIRCSDSALTVCRLETPVRFQLRGACQTWPGTDSQYTLVNSSHMIGNIQNVITKNTDGWTLLDQDSKVLSVASSPDFPLGKLLWTMGENGTCEDREGSGSRTMLLHLYTEQPGHFCCDNGYCMDSRLRCDFKQHCLDNSDEKNCQLISVSPGYSLVRPPQPGTRVSQQDTSAESLTEVRADLTILDILDIDDTDSVFKVFFTLELRWTDLNLHYCYLHQDENYNIISDDIIKQIWKPDIGFIHLKGKLEKLNQVVHLEKVSSPSLSEDLNEVEVCESYSGVENPLHFKTVNVAGFSCGFDNIIENYPFGRQNCTLSFFITKNDNTLTNLTLGSLTDLGPSSSGEYLISGWVMETGNIKDHNGKVITVYLGLSRNFLREVLPKCFNEIHAFTLRSFEYGL